jgi:hypothetical protein
MRLYRTYAPDGVDDTSDPWTWFSSKKEAMRDARKRAEDCLAGQESAEVWEVQVKPPGGRPNAICHVLNYGPRVTGKRLVAKVPGAFRRDEE